MYHVYGIGNALVDFEFEVTENELNRMNVDKGVMTLIDEHRHEDLLGKLHGIKHSRACGGSAANSIIAVSQLGGKSFYSCKVGNDETGEFYIKDLNANGVQCNVDIGRRTNGTTGKCIVMVTPDADRTMNTFLGITSNISAEDLDRDAILQSQYCYIEGYLVSSDSALDAAITGKKLAQGNQVKTGLSLSDPNMVKYFKPGLDAVIGDGVDLLFCNHEEAMAYTETDNIEAAAGQLQSIARQFAITLGSQGALLYDGKDFIKIEAFEVKAKDTNGAGDLFAGAFLYGLTHGYTFSAAGKLASFASALLVTQFGPRLNDENMSKVNEFVKTL